MRLYVTENIPWQDDVMKKLSRDPAVSGYFRELIHSLRNIYEKIAFAVNGLDQIATAYNLVYDTNITVNWNNGGIQKVTLAGNPTISFSNWKAGRIGRLILIQDATGSRTVTWNETIKWKGGSAPTLTTTANKADIITFICDKDKTIYGMADLNF